MLKRFSQANVLVLTKQKAYSGITATAKRITQYYEENNCFCACKDVSHFMTRQDFMTFLKTEEIQVILAVDASSASEILSKDPYVPYAVILSGKDLFYEKFDRKSSFALENVVLNSRKLVVYAEGFTSHVIQHWPTVDEDKIMSILPAVKTNPSFRQISDIKEYYRITVDAMFFIIVTGLKPEKDPLHLVSAFTEWHQILNRDVFLVIIGPKWDREFGDKFEDLVDACPAILYLGSQATYTSHAFIRDSFALVDCSKCSGWSLPILEAMKLGVPVIARDTPANRVLIENRKTGMIYSDPKDFIQVANELLTKPSLRETIVNNSKKIIEGKHSIENEKNAFVSLAKDLKTLYDPGWHNRYQTDLQMQEEKVIVNDVAEKEMNEQSKSAKATGTKGKLRRARSAKMKFNRVSRKGNTRSKKS